MESPAINSPVFTHRAQTEKSLPKWNFQGEFSMSTGAFTLASTHIYSITWLFNLQKCLFRSSGKIQKEEY